MQIPKMNQWKILLTNQKIYLIKGSEGTKEQLLWHGSAHIYFL